MGNKISSEKYTLRKGKYGAMNIFSEVKQQITARQAAESYGLQIRKNGMACCPFHNDRHPSMKIDSNYHCFACGAGGDAVDYVSRMFGLSQYDAACKLIEDFHLSVDVKGSAEENRREKERIRREWEEQQRIVHIKKRFKRWCNQAIEMLKETLAKIQELHLFLIGKPPDVIFCEEYAQILYAEVLADYWLDLLCMGSTKEKQELFIKDRREVDRIAERVRIGGERILERNRGSA